MRSIATILATATAACLLAASVGGAQGHPELVFGDYQQLLTRKQTYQQHRGAAEPASDKLIARAEHELTQPPATVMQKKQIADSGDKHDYLSLAPYWWPDPDQPDGLPYLRRDGRVNPTTRGDSTDHQARGRMLDRVHTLGVAAFITEEPRYAEGAVAQLEAWFVDPATRMNPHLRYAQSIPGDSQGRCYGIIEWRSLDKLITPIQLLRARNAIPAPTDRTLTHWFEDYLHWLQTSELGQRERDRPNNHGTWYDVQVAGLLLFLGRQAEAREVLEAVKTKRIATQIEPDGRQPLELARTKSLSYSKMNLRAFERLAQLGEKVGVDLANYQTPDGRSIRQAEAFLAPYVRGDKQWPYQQL